MGWEFTRSLDITSKAPTNLLTPCYPGSCKGCLLLLLGRHSSSCTLQLVQDSEIPGGIPEQIPASLPRPWVPEARQSAGCFSSRVASWCHPLMGCVSSLHSPAPRAVGALLSSHVLWESWKRCLPDLWDHPLLREERGKLSACTWSSQVVTWRTTNELRQGLAFLDTLHCHLIPAPALHFASPCSADYENALQGCLRSDATFTSALLFERTDLCRITFYRTTESWQTTATAFPSCTKQVTLSWKIRLVRQGLCWLGLINCCSVPALW